jgi:uncharacterized protein YjcR
MNRKNNIIREIFQRMHKMGKKVAEIAKILAIKRQTIYNWKKLDQDRLMLESSQKTRQTKLDLVKFQEYLEENPAKFNREIGEVFGIKKSTAHKWKKRLGFTRKKAKTSYKEADLELKKSSKKT